MAVQEPGIVDLIRTALSDANDLIRSEIALAKAELRQQSLRTKSSEFSRRPLTRLMRRAIKRMIYYRKMEVQ